MAHDRRNSTRLGKQAQSARDTDLAPFCAMVDNEGLDASMKTYRLDLLFAGQPEDALPGPARSHVCVKNWSSVDYAKDAPLITSECVSIQELECQIDELHNELEAIRATARGKYDAYYHLEQ